MTPPKQPPELSVSDLKGVTDSNLEKGAKKVENPDEGEGVNPVNPRRDMRFYKISENELGSLSALNDATVGVYSLIATLVTFAIDVGKDFVLTDEIPPLALEMVKFGLPIFVIVLLILLFIASRLRKARRSVVTLIRDESSNGEDKDAKGKGWKLQWPLSKKP